MAKSKQSSYKDVKIHVQALESWTVKFGIPSDLLAVETNDITDEVVEPDVGPPTDITHLKM